MNGWHWLAIIVIIAIFSYIVWEIFHDDDDDDRW